MQKVTKEESLDFNFNFKGPDGSEITGQNAGVFLANQLAGSVNKQADPIKLWGWAQKLHSGDALILDESDKATLKEFIKSAENVTVLAKAQLLELVK
jgi:hypothetical protein